MQIDVRTGRPSLGNGGGGLSGPNIHPVAVRAVHDVAVQLPSVDIVGVGGISTGEDAVEMMMAGARAVQVGTATFARPDACARVRDGAAAVLRSRGNRSWAEVHRIALG
jgi:dihydroorotate dehydrogenase (NAD+) catalytic subunit